MLIFPCVSLTLWSALHKQELSAEANKGAFAGVGKLHLFHVVVNACQVLYLNVRGCYSIHEYLFFFFCLITYLDFFQILTACFAKALH